MIGGRPGKAGLFWDGKKVLVNSNSMSHESPVDYRNTHLNLQHS